MFTVSDEPLERVVLASPLRYARMMSASIWGKLKK
jgi:hypothetical protein